MTHYGYLVRMRPERLMKRRFGNFDKHLKTEVRWFPEIKKDLEEMKLTKETSS